MGVVVAGLRFCVPLVLFALPAGCVLGPSEERLECLRGCGRRKDSCVLASMNAAQLQGCDAESKRCDAVCP